MKGLFSQSIYFPQYYRKSLPGSEVYYSWPAHPVLLMVEVGWLSHTNVKTDISARVSIAWAPWLTC